MSTWCFDSEKSLHQLSAGKFSIFLYIHMLVLILTLTSLATGAAQSRVSWGTAAGHTWSTYSSKGVKWTPLRELYHSFNQPNYTKTESAIELLGDAKKNLTEPPFLKYFEYRYGHGKESYWTSDNMALQFEDCINCIHALFPQFDSVWQFDHSCGQDRGWEDGLNVSKMSVNWGGEQCMLPSTQILQEEGFLWLHSPKLTFKVWF